MVNRTITLLSTRRGMVAMEAVQIVLVTIQTVIAVLVLTR